jgi:hypothetical protein
MADSKVAQQLRHVMRAKHIPDQTLSLALQKLALLAGHDTRSILPPVLQHC